MYKRLLTVLFLMLFCSVQSIFASITVTSPNGGETWDSGSGQNITWSVDAGETNFDIAYSTDNGSNWITIATNVAGTAYLWTIPNPATAQALVRVSENSNSANNDVSDAVFTISNPILLATPLNGRTGVSIQPEFTWTVPGATTTPYHLRIATTSGALSAATPVYDGAGLSYTLTEDQKLANGTLYYWQVSDDNGLTSDIYHFTTYAEFNIGLQAPANGVSLLPNDIVFSWYTTVNYTGLEFTLQYLATNVAPTQESDWSTAVSATTTNYNYTASGLYAGKTYYWRVIVKRASNHEIVNYSSVYSFTISGGSSVTMYPLWPKGGPELYRVDQRFSWNTSLYMTGFYYQLKYGTSGTDAAPADGEMDGGTKIPEDGDITSSGIVDLYYDFPSLTPATTYYWQVRGYYPDSDIDADPTNGPEGWTAWSTIENFTISSTLALQVPIPTYPKDGVDVYSTSPYLYWYYLGTPTGVYYDVQYGTTSGALDHDILHVTDLEVQLAGLNPGTTYYWRVRSNDGTNPATTWSAEQEFHVIGGVSSSYPVATHPILNHTVYTVQPTLYWYLEGSSLGLTGYVVKYKKDSAPGDWTAFNPASNDANGGQYSIGSISNLNKQIDDTNLDYGGHYFWAVYATDGVNPSAVSNGEFSVVGAGGGSVELVAPGDGWPVYGATTTLAWYYYGSTLGITGYEYLVSDSDVFSNTITTGITSNLNVEITGLQGGTTYFWKVRSLPSGSWSTPFSFTVVPGSANIVVQPLVGGPRNLTLSTTSPQLTWRVPVATAANAAYEVQLADNSNFSNARVLASNKGYVNTAGLEGGKKYYWKVRAVGTSGDKSAYSSPAEFSISGVTAVEDKPVVPAEFELSQNYPNPFNPTTVIKFSLPEAAYVSLKIYDMLGREVKTLISQQSESGVYNVTWNGDDNFGVKVSSGSYVYRITAGDFVQVKKMVLIK